MEYEYIFFVLMEEKPKTDVYGIFNKKSNYMIGWVKWHSAWRQFCFFPFGSTVFSAGCMKDIIDFIQKLKDKKKCLWKNNKECPNCGKIIEGEHPIRCCEFGFSYCSAKCAKEYVNKYYKEEE